MFSGSVKGVAFVPLDSRHPRHPSHGWDDGGGENDGGGGVSRLKVRGIIMTCLCPRHKNYINYPVTKYCVCAISVFAGLKKREKMPDEIFDFHPY